MSKEKKEPAKLVYLGKDIYLAGPEGTTKEIVDVSHIYQDGTSETIGLRFNTPYQVGGKDANGRIIKDWVYEYYLTSDYNNTRKKSRVEIESEANMGTSPLDLSL